MLILFHENHPQTFHLPCWLDWDKLKDEIQYHAKEMGLPLQVEITHLFQPKKRSYLPCLTVCPHDFSQNLFGFLLTQRRQDGCIFGCIDYLPCSLLLPWKTFSARVENRLRGGFFLTHSVKSEWEELRYYETILHAIFNGLSRYTTKFANQK